MTSAPNNKAGAAFPVPSAAPTGTSTPAPSPAGGTAFPTPVRSDAPQTHIKLVAVNGSRPGTAHPVTAGRFLIGRPDPMAGIAPDIDLTADEGAAPQRTVSRAHAELEWRGAGWTVRDLNSAHGTRVGATRLAPGADHPVKVGDRIAFGAIVFAVEADAP